MKKYNLSKIMKRAWELVKEVGMAISSALKKVWKEAKSVTTEVKNVVVENFCYYNARRYSTPWVCLVEDGKYDFSQDIGTFTGDANNGGNLVVYKPVVGQVYGWGQKDYRGGNTIKKFSKWTGVQFVECDKLGVEF